MRAPFFEEPMPKLVIVESPAKAKTISRFLGGGYTVLASYGHIRDLPEKQSQIPANLRSESWANLGVNVDSKFEPIYVVPPGKQKYVDALKRAAQTADEILLATDEDREGESISWHILQLIKPQKTTTVKRIVFHEVTDSAMHAALESPRSIDEDLVKSQESRRITDRLFGYTISPLLWKKVGMNLSAGRVQSIAVRLIVEKERERQRFRSAEFWDLKVDLQAKKGRFTALLTHVDGRRIATNDAFDPETGVPKSPETLVLTKPDAVRLAEEARAAQDWFIHDLNVELKTRKPPPPFMTSTLQQEANRKLRMTAKRSMQVAQALYEGVDLGSDREGLITYMRTDSLVLAESAIQQARDVIEDRFGKEFLPSSRQRYTKKIKGAQEAHEAIRPSDLRRHPESVKQYLTDEQFALYRMIWERTVASQMKPAEIESTGVVVQATTESGRLQLSASGNIVKFMGFLRAYVEGSDEAETSLESTEQTLPHLTKGEPLDLVEVSDVEHHTGPPQRYTEATLVKKLEDEGIGRPSTYAAIIGTIQDRGYVFKLKNALVPTFTAFAVNQILEDHFEELVDIKFTALMEKDLDRIAAGKEESFQFLKRFYYGDGKKSGLAPQVAQKAADIPFPKIQIGVDAKTAAEVVVRIGKHGAFLQRGEGGSGNTATVPENLPPADLTISRAVDLLDKKAQGPEAIAHEPESNRSVFLKSGRFGDYLEVEQSEEEVQNGVPPRRVTLPPGLHATDITSEIVQLLLQFPRNFPDSLYEEHQVVINIGRYGAYVKAGSETRNIPDWREALNLSAADAIELLKTPKASSRANTKVVSEPIRDYGVLEDSGAPVRLMSGRYGPYVTDGSTNATLPKGKDPATLTPEAALELLVAKRAAGPSKRFRRAKPARIKAAPRRTSNKR